MSTRACQGKELGSPIKRINERGQALVEWMVVAVLATMVAIWAAGDWATKIEDRVAQGYAHWLNALATGIDQALRYSDANDESLAVWRDQLPLNVPVPIEPWIKRLKQDGWLPSALGPARSLPYQVSLLRLDAQQDCQTTSCPMAILLLATPKPGVQQSIPHPAALVSELGAKGLAVTDLAPHRLQGAVFQIDNPLAQGVALPVGTVALLAWRSDQPSPYVRINESRVVNLSGGLRLGQVANAGSACSPLGLVMTSRSGELVTCFDGQWQSVSRDHDHLRACNKPSGKDAMAELLIGALFGFRPSCDCPSGFVPVDVGSDRDRVGPIRLHAGYLCQRL